MKVLVLDTVHGGKIIAETYLKNGDDVTVVDVYHITPRDVLGGLSRRGIRVADHAPAEDFDLCVMPVHCPDGFIGEARPVRIIDSSQAVKEMFDPYDKRFRIEVTGAKGKTSTCYLVAHILDAAGRRTYLHTSRGMGPYYKGEHIFTDLQSTTPSTLLVLPRTEYDVMVCEVSLGGSGRADIGVITNLVEDYGIAADSKKAHEGEKDVLTDGINIVRADEESTWSVYGKPLRLSHPRVKVTGKPRFGEPLRVDVDYRGNHDVVLGSDYLALQYVDAMDIALEVCDAMDIPADAVIRGLETFHGVPGRGQISVEDGVRVIRDRNPGTSHISIDYVLSVLKRMDVLDDAVLVVDAPSRKVFERMDRDLIAEVAARYGVRLVMPDEPGAAVKVPEGASTVVCMVKEGFQ